ncbi:hypothetical protein HDK90DRAFT_481651 [Phyllosticta capitalensis]|uniref:Uncharacterized protein n=1 Tax=Phyllosticta capitalensis TaxID=121624 RepID=A0ABR1YS87_9PEZI
MEWKPPVAAAQQHESLASYSHAPPLIGTQTEEDIEESQGPPISNPRDYLRNAQRLLRHMIHRKTAAVSEPQATHSTLESSVVPGYCEAPTTPLRRAADESRAYCEWCAELEAPVQPPVELEVPSTTIPELAFSSLERTPRSTPLQSPTNWPLSPRTGPTQRQDLEYSEDIFSGASGARMPTRTLTVRPMRPETSSPSSYDRSSRTWSSSDSTHPAGTWF